MTGLDRTGMGRAALAALLAVTLGLAACGGSDGDGAPAAAAPDRPAGEPDARDGEQEAAGGGQEAADLTGPEAEIHETYATMVERFYAQDAEGVCGLMTEAARRPERNEGVPCVERFTTLWRTGRLGEHKPFIVKLRIRGSKAHARVKTKTSELYPVEFTREDGGWKISDGM